MVRHQEGLPCWGQTCAVWCKGMMIPRTQGLEASYPKSWKPVRGCWHARGNNSLRDTVVRSLGGGGQPSPTEEAAGSEG